MSTILVVYATNAGSTAEVAESIAAGLISGGHSVKVQPVSAVTDLQAYDSFVVGAPMIFGWQNTARCFLKRHQADLLNKKVAVFACALRLTCVPGETLPSFPLYIDPGLPSEPVKAGSLSLKERFTTTGHYLKPMLQSAPGLKPVSAAFFKGKLEMFRLKWWQALFVMAVVQAPPGDFRDWDAIQSWGKSLVDLL